MAGELQPRGSSSIVKYEMSGYSDSDVFETPPAIEPLGEGTNFYAWKKEITDLLKTYKLWDIVSGTKHRPLTPPSEPSTPITEPTPPQKEWDKSETQAAGVLRMYLDNDLRSLYDYPISAAEIWRSLMRRFHKQDGGTLIRSFQAISSLCFVESDENTIIEHLEVYDRLWNDFEDRTSDAPKPVPGRQNSLLTALNFVARSEGSKAQYLMNSLSPSMRRSAALMSYQLPGVLGYWQLRQLLLQIHGINELEKLLSADKKPERQNGQECTWCRSRKFKSKGHTWKECRRLKNHRGGKAKGRSKRGVEA